MPQEELYRDNRIRITSGPNGDDHLVTIDQLTYRLDYGALVAFASTPRGLLETALGITYEDILRVAKTRGTITPAVGVDGLHVAFCQAATEEERRIRAFRTGLENAVEDDGA